MVVVAPTESTPWRPTYVPPGPDQPVKDHGTHPLKQRLAGVRSRLPEQTLRAVYVSRRLSLDFRSLHLSGRLIVRSMSTACAVDEFVHCSAATRGGLGWNRCSLPHMTAPSVPAPSLAHGRRVRHRVTVRALAVLVLLVNGFLPAPAGASVSIASSRPGGDGVWTWPLWPQPRVQRAFDAPDGPYAAGHRGVDLLGRSGQAVRAVDGGTVVYAGRVGGIDVVSLDTPAGRVTYQPVSASVRRGATVHAGAVLGRLRTTGGHCLPLVCLHLGLIVTGEYQDPLRLLGAGPVRLLPLGDAPPRPFPVTPRTGAGLPREGVGSPPSRTFLEPASSAGSPVAVRLGLSLGRGLQARG